MAKIIAPLLFVISVTVAFASEDFSKWINYTSPKGHYSVSVPHEPAVSLQQATTETGVIGREHLASTTEKSTTYVIEYYDHAAAISFSFNKARDGMVDAVKGTLLSENAINLNGAPGLKLKISSVGKDNLDYITHARFYHVGHRVYCIQFIIPKSEDAAATEKMNKYFDSFKVVKAPAK